mgnify:CR=1 FL=1
MNQPKVIDREQEIVFTNWTLKDFEHKWAKRIYRFKAEKSYYLPFYLAEHFGKHLVTRELNDMAREKIEATRKSDPRTDAKEIERLEQSIINNANLRQQFMDKCVQITEPTDMSIVIPREVPVREVKLKSQERSENYINQGIVAPSDTAQRVTKKDESSFEGVDV